MSSYKGYDRVVLIGAQTDPGRSRAFVEAAKLLHPDMDVAVVDTAEYLEENSQALVEMGIPLDRQFAVEGSIDDPRAVADAVIKAKKVGRPLVIANQEYLLPVAYEAMRLLIVDKVILRTPYTDFQVLQKPAQLAKLIGHYGRPYRPLPNFESSTDSDESCTVDPDVLRRALRDAAKFTNNFHGSYVVSLSPGGGGMNKLLVLDDEPTRKTLCDNARRARHSLAAERGLQAERALRALAERPMMRGVARGEYHIERFVPDGTNVGIRGEVLANGEVVITDWSQKITRAVPALMFDKDQGKMVPIGYGLKTFREGTVVYYPGYTIPGPLARMAKDGIKAFGFPAGPFVFDGLVARSGTSNYQLVKRAVLDQARKSELHLVEGNFRLGGNGHPEYSARIGRYKPAQLVLAAAMDEGLPSPYLGPGFHGWAIATRAVAPDEMWLMDALEGMGVPFKPIPHPVVDRAGKIAESQIAEATLHLREPLTLEFSGPVEQVEYDVNVAEALVTRFMAAQERAGISVGL